MTVSNSGNATAAGGGKAISGAQTTAGAGPVQVDRSGDARAEGPGSVAISGAASLTVQQPLPPSPYQVYTSLDDDTADFTGRHEEVQAFLDLTERSNGQGGVFTIHGGIQAIDGMPGVGKTAVAVHLAHLVKDRFPDRQAAPELDDAGQALAWARAERANLLACIDHATGTGQRARVVALTAALAGLLRRDGPWADAITRHTTAIEAAQRLGDRLGQANALSDLGAVRRLTDDYPAAAQDLEQALGIYRDLGNRLGQANALSDLGAVQRLTDDYPAAAQDLEQALGICRDLGNRSGEAEALNERGTLHRLSGELARAERCHQQALELAHAIASSWDEAHALVGLGRCAMAVGNAAQAKAVLRQALEISSGSAQPRSQPYSPN